MPLMPCTRLLQYIRILCASSDSEWTRMYVHMYKPTSSRKRFAFLFLFLFIWSSPKINMSRGKTTETWEAQRALAAYYIPKGCGAPHGSASQFTQFENCARRANMKTNTRRHRTLNGVNMLFDGAIFCIRLIDTCIHFLRVPKMKRREEK